MACRQDGDGIFDERCRGVGLDGIWKRDGEVEREEIYKMSDVAESRGGGFFSGIVVVGVWEGETADRKG